MKPRRLAFGVRAVAAAALVSCQAARAETPAPAPALQVEPRNIDVGMFFRGATVRVEGSAPQGFRLALVLSGREGTVELKRKGKVLSLLWMNVGSVTFERVPSVFLISADPEGPGGAAPTLPGPLRLGLGYAGLETQVLPADADEITRDLFRQFIRLKEKERLYSSRPLRGADPSGDPAGVLLTGLGRPDAPAQISAESPPPPRTPPGEYEFRLIGFREGTGQVLATEKIVVERVGFARLIASMAVSHGLLYGILSVVAALAAGYVSGVLFAGAKKGH